MRLDLKSPLAKLCGTIIPNAPDHSCQERGLHGFPVRSPQKDLQITSEKQQEAHGYSRRSWNDRNEGYAEGA